MASVIDTASFSNAARLCGALTQRWPEHRRFLDQSMAGRGDELLASTDRHSEMILQILGGDIALSEACDDYRFLCGKLMEEDFYFRRNRKYRLDKFADAVSEVYSNSEFMQRYMNFLLLSHVFWANHARTISHFEKTFLPSLPAGTDHLEIGPGHGLLLHLACLSPNVGSVTGWDVSQTSIDQARKCLEAMGQAHRVELVTQDLFDEPALRHRKFGSVALSEVLEHLEDPVAALRATARHMTPSARLWVNVPINSPAPDHIYLLRTTEEAVDLLRAGGFEPLDAAFHPMTGYDLEQARKRELTISAVITARLQSSQA